MKLLFASLLALLAGGTALIASPCDTDSFVVNLSVSDTVLCRGEYVDFRTEPVGGIGGYSYVWRQVNSTVQMGGMHLKESEWVHVSVTSEGCPDPVADSVFIRVKEVVADFSFDANNLYVAGNSIKVNNASKNSALVTATIFRDEQIYQHYTFQEQRQYEFLFTEAGAYQLKFVVYDVSSVKDSLLGSRAIHNLFLEISEGMQLAIPNAFSPEKRDGVNDSLFVWTAGVSALEFFVFDRRGQRVFYSNELDFKWDGTTDNGRRLNGAYYYVLKASNALEEQVFSGVLHIL